MDFSKLNAAEQAHMTKYIEKKQASTGPLLPDALMHDFMNLYAGLVERCFTSCCSDFTSKALSGKEETCVMNCADKFLKHTERVGARFAEHNGACLTLLFA
ncbi:mitochondrial import inner membrane translocase subunit TIM9 [Sistotremastrum niveocremeum HHB9708]|uniref:Mitochondrial import inner membrane translocase subunit n=1 Tax=Sistotremastrum niveocremeum HHB9708 TaxID=1314777 RepID=A0A164T5U4_9AGAM|nr:mitochondrial import inner membrane translocase subunit TIM9 [Sistotremastrum niveocremeum HHB9708]